MKKPVKILLRVLLGIVALVVVALLALPIWLGPVAKAVANSVVPGIVKTDFRLEQLVLNPYSGRFELGDMKLSNPQGYSEKYAATLGKLAVAVNVGSLMTDTVHIEEVRVNDVFVSIVSKDGVGNFKQIQYNVAGGKEKYEAAQAEKEAAEAVKLEKPEAAKPEVEKAETTEPGQAEKPQKKFVIDHLEISGVKLQYGFLPISLPITISINDIGKEKGSEGATLSEVGNRILEEILKAAGVAGDQLKALGGLVGGAATKAAGAVGDAAGQAADAAGQAATAVADSATKAVGAVGDVAGQAAGVAGQTATAVADSASKAAEGATKAVGDATKAVGDGAKKAMDSLKKLW